MEILQHEPHFYKQFNLIILSGCTVDMIDLFNTFCHDNNIHLIVIRDYSQVAFVQLFSKERVIFNSRSTIVSRDYHITRPWKELEDFCTQLEPEHV